MDESQQAVAEVVAAVAELAQRVDQMAAALAAVRAQLDALANNQAGQAPRAQTLLRRGR